MRPSFRETLWFKKGHLQAEAASKQSADDTGTTEADSLPIEDRYADDGSLEPTDSEMFGVHSGATQAMKLITPAMIADAAVPEGALIAEMKRGRHLVLAMIALAVLAVAGAAMTLI